MKNYKKTNEIVGEGTMLAVQQMILMENRKRNRKEYIKMQN